MISYFLKVAIVQLLLVIFYLIFKNNPSFKIKRWYILIGLLFSFLIPIFESSVHQEDLAYFSVILEPVNAISESEFASSFNWIGLISQLYISVCVLFFLFLIFKILQVVYLFFTAKNKHMKNNSWIINHPKLTSDFSFFNWIFIKQNQNDQELIFLHELVHVKELHSIDILLVELNKCLFWFLPTSYWIVNETKLNHEFIADQDMIKSCDKVTYQETLLANAFQTNSTLIGSTFSFSKLKTRFMMMNNQKSQKKSWKFILTIPLVAIVSLGFAFAKNSDLKPGKNALSFTEFNQTVKDPDVQPEYPGGMSELAKFIGDNLKYPESAKNEKIAGKVIISFMVDKNGYVKNVAIKQNLQKDCDAEALRVVKMLPKWKPGQKDGKAVNVEMILPISFSL